MSDQVFIGKMDRRVKITKRITTRGSTGAENFTEELIATVWAEKRGISSDKEKDDKIIALNVVTFLMRWIPEIYAEKLQTLYVEDGGDQYEVYGFEEIGRKQFLRLKCQHRE